MKRALIGHTGFVGGNLRAQSDFDACFNTSNIGELRGHFDEIVCAGVTAVKWLANKEPQADAAGIERLVTALRRVTCDRFVHISTVDVFGTPIDVDESSVVEPAHPYGQHRYELERTLAGMFGVLHVVRLPGLFGPGLKKNVVYDLMNDHRVAFIDPDAAFQFYDLKYLTGDIAIALDNDLPLLHIAPEPVPTHRIAALFGRTLPGKEGPHARYDLRTRYADLWGRSDGYQYDADAVLADMKAFVS